MNENPPNPTQPAWKVGLLAADAVERCGAKTRRGTACQTAAMSNGRCRMHGGSSPKGVEHGRFKHGHGTKQAKEERALIRAMLKENRLLLRTIEKC